MIKLFIELVLLSCIADAFFYEPSIMPRLPYQSDMASATRNNSLVLFGGSNITHAFSKELYQLTQTSDSFDWQALEQMNPPTITGYGKAVITNSNQIMYLIGGSNPSNKKQELPLQVYQYSFESSTWTSSPENSLSAFDITSFPRNRYFHSVTYDNNNKIYIYGGAANSTFSKNGTYSYDTVDDFFSFDITTQEYSRLPDSNEARYDHTASLLSNGQLVLIGGVTNITVVNGTGDSYTIAKPVTYISIFDTLSNTWEDISASDSLIPNPRRAHVSEVTSDDTIIVFGGRDQDEYSDEIYILNTKNWTWSVPRVTGVLPSKRAFASSGILNDRYLTVGFGSVKNEIYYNDINVFDISTNQWVQKFIEPDENTMTHLSTNKIIGITIACLILLLSFILFWKFPGHVRRFFKRIFRAIWKPRIGEPVWTEVTRIILQVILLFIFCAFLVIAILQATESPNITQTIVINVEEVQVPDVRFCQGRYAGEPSNFTGTFRVSCETDVGFNCDSYIKQLDLTVFKPTYSENLDEVSYCYLFSAPTDFVLTAETGTVIGSRLLFKFWDSDGAGRIHTSIYPKTRNPNIVIYNISDAVTTEMSATEVLEWQINERNDVQDTDVFDIDPVTYNIVSYSLVEHTYLQDTGWNYVGFSPISNTKSEVNINFRGNVPDPNYANKEQENDGAIAIFPHAYATTVEREVKVYTLVNALGFVGGIIGLLIAFQAWLFGYRPNSPWGVVHRWSMGSLKRSLLRNLQSKFKPTNSGIPLVDPVRYESDSLDSDTLKQDDIRHFKSRVEERLQMLETLFKVYYVDDEVFRSLDSATQEDSSRLMSGIDSGTRRNSSSSSSSSSSSKTNDKAGAKASMLPR
ncbi:hypothetical protein BD770DRAFT_372607 [Pilaira anomala]|nr:hypothetical protein BD770DRAFT_372607 [Pilaira anomala]